jgi:hypothetical protein
MWWMYFDYQSRKSNYCLSHIQITQKHNCFFVSRCVGRVKSKYGYLYHFQSWSRFRYNYYSSYKNYFSNYGNYDKRI